MDNNNKRASESLLSKIEKEENDLGHSLSKNSKRFNKRKDMSRSRSRSINIKL